MPKLGMPLGEFSYGVDLVVRSLYCGWTTAAEDLRLNPNREELGIKPAFLRAHRVEVSVSEALRKINVFIEQTLRGIACMSMQLPLL